MPETYPILRYGDGFPSRDREHLRDAVRRLQTLLGFAGDNVDGLFGKGTEAAVGRVQRIEGFVENGIVREALWVWLEHLNEQGLPPDSEASPIRVTPALLTALGVDARRAGVYADPIDRAAERAEVNTPLRMAHWLAQLLHESGMLRYSREIWGHPSGTPQQKKYEPPHALAIALGNTQPGDGYRYRGAGLIQLTGRHNWTGFADWLDLTLPQLEGMFDDNPRLHALAAAYYWQRENLNRYADRDDARGLTRAVNGGLTGLADRERLLTKAKEVLNQ